MPFLLLALFVVVPLVELYVIIQVGQWLGALPTIGLLVLSSVLGTVLMRSQGRAVWRRFREAMLAGRVPAREVLDGVLVIVGGALLLAPGFLTDALGILLLAPPSRAAIRRVLLRGVRGRLLLGLAGGVSRRGRGRRGYDVDGTAQDVDPPGLR